MSVANRFAPPGTVAAHVETPEKRRPETRFTIWTKRIAAIVVACSYVLPLASCNHKSYSASDNEIDTFLGCASLLLYFWPVVFETVGWLFSRHGLGRRWPLPRFILLGGLAVLVSYLASWSDSIRYGAVLTYAAGTCYAAALWMALARDRRGAAG